MFKQLKRFSSNFNESLRTIKRTGGALLRFHQRMEMEAVIKDVRLFYFSKSKKSKCLILIYQEIYQEIFQYIHQLFYSKVFPCFPKKNERMLECPQAQIMDQAFAMAAISRRFTRVMMAINMFHVLFQNVSVSSNTCLYYIYIYCLFRIWFQRFWKKYIDTVLFFWFITAITDFEPRRRHERQDLDAKVWEATKDEIPTYPKSRNVSIWDMESLNHVEAICRNYWVMTWLWWLCLVLGDARRPPECQMYVKRSDLPLWFWSLGRRHTFWHMLNRAAGCPKSLPYLQMCKRHKEFMWKLDQEPTWPNHTLTRAKSVQFQPFVTALWSGGSICLESGKFHVLWGVARSELVDVGRSTCVCTEKPFRHLQTV